MCDRCINLLYEPEMSIGRKISRNNVYGLYSVCLSVCLPPPRPVSICHSTPFRLVDSSRFNICVRIITIIKRISRRRGGRTGGGRATAGDTHRRSRNRFRSLFISYAFLHPPATRAHKFIPDTREDAVPGIVDEKRARYLYVINARETIPYTPLAVCLWLGYRRRLGPYCSPARHGYGHRP